MTKLPEEFTFRTLTNFRQPVDKVLADLEDLGVEFWVKFRGQSFEDAELLFKFTERKSLSLAAAQMAVEIHDHFMSDELFSDAVCEYAITLGTAIHPVDRAAWEFRPVSHEEIAAERAVKLS